MNNTPIEWCDFTWNPITGCPGPKVSPGCKNCYAERVMNTRLRHLYSEERPFEHIHFHPERLDQPRKLKRPSRIFVGSMCDLFHDQSEVMWLAEIFHVMAECPQHTFCLLTKRSERMSDVLTFIAAATLAHGGVWHLSNVWVGVTICNQEEADRLIPVLMEIPAAKRFISFEPLLGPVYLTRWPEEFSPLLGLTDWSSFEWPEWVPDKIRQELTRFWNKDHRGAAGYNRQFGSRWVAAPAFGMRMGIKEDNWVCSPHALKAVDTGRFVPMWSNIGRLVLDSGEVRYCAFSHGPSYLSLWPQLGKSYDEPHMRRIDWIVCGGETGPGARPMHPEWVRSLRDECQLEPTPGVHNPPPVPFFFKGWGEWIAVNYDDYPDWQHRDGGKGIFTNLDPKRGIFWDQDSAYRPDEKGVSRKIFGTDLMFRVGKCRSGRLLNGREWNEVPS